MKLEWMGDYRDIVEQLIRYSNIYSTHYKEETLKGTTIPISYAQIQIIEYLLENEELQLNMKQIATRLGITTSNFSKLVHKLEAKGLLEKFHSTDNKKNIIILVTDFGRKEYINYTNYIYKKHFSKMFKVADKLPREVLPVIANMLAAPNNYEKPEVPTLIPISKE